MARVRELFETCCDDSHRRHLARHRTHGRCAGTDTALARVVAVSAAQPHCAYLFANRRANRMKVLVHDGLGIWLAAPTASRQVFLAGISARLTDGAGCRTTACPGAGFTLAKSWAKQCDHPDVITAMASVAVHCPMSLSLVLSVSGCCRVTGFTQSEPGAERVVQCRVILLNEKLPC